MNFRVGFWAAVLAMGMLAARADSIQTATGTQQGMILRSDENGITLKTDAAEMQIRWENVRVVTMDAPVEFRAAKAAYEAAKADPTKWLQVVEAVKPVADKFPKMPTSWAQDAALWMIEAHGQAGQLDKAEEWQKKFQKWYPKSPALLKAVAGLARAMAAQSPEQAVKLLEQTLETKLKQLTVSEEEGKSLGASMNVLGECYEQMAARTQKPEEKKMALEKALDAYLATKVLYYHDVEATKIASDKSEALKTQVATLTAKLARLGK